MSTQSVNMQLDAFTCPSRKCTHIFVTITHTSFPTFHMLEEWAPGYIAEVLEISYANTTQMECSSFSRWAAKLLHYSFKNISLVCIYHSFHLAIPSDTWGCDRQERNTSAQFFRPAICVTFFISSKIILSKDFLSRSKGRCFPLPKWRHLKEYFYSLERFFLLSWWHCIIIQSYYIGPNKSRRT